MAEYTYWSLPNGLRCVHRLSKSDVEYCGVVINAGSRDEQPCHFGLSHFVEHTIFKGTCRRHAYHIINRMEAVGGELNAYTTKETTAVYSIFPRGNLMRAVELIADLVGSSQFPEREIAKEREVVADEIQSYLDVPSEAIFDDFEDMAFAGSSLGHNILGTEATLATFDSATCRDFLKSHYTPGNMVFFYLGPSSTERVQKISSRYFGGMPAGQSPIARIAPPWVAPFDKTVSINSHQAHVVTGARIEGIYSPDRFAMALLTNMLGGPGMNSRLNVALREKRGLVYTVEASTALFADCGLFTVYYGCDADDLNKCRRLVSEILDRVAYDGITQSELNRARRQYLGQLAVGSDNREQMALSIGRSTLYRGEATPSRDIEAAIRAISVDDIRRVAEALLPDKMSTLVFT